MTRKIEHSNIGFTDDIVTIFTGEECKWPNLKKLVEDKTPLKFKVKDKEQYKELKDFFLSIGSNVSKDFNTTYNEYVVYIDPHIKENGPFKLISCGDISRLFACNPAIVKEFDFANDCLVEEENPIPVMSFNASTSFKRISREEDLKSAIVSAISLLNYVKDKL